VRPASVGRGIDNRAFVLPVIVHLLEKLFQVGKPKLPIARSKISRKGVKLARGNLVSLDRVALAVKCSHVFEEAPGDFGGQFLRLTLDRHTPKLGAWGRDCESTPAPMYLESLKKSEWFTACGCSDFDYTTFGCLKDVLFLF
jgi:hypothetical protein